MVMHNKKHEQAETYEYLWRAKWTADGAETLDDMASMLEDAAKGLREMAETGKVWLAQPVQDDYAFILTEDAETAKRFGFNELEDEEDEEEDE